MPAKSPSWFAFDTVICMHNVPRNCNTRRTASLNFSFGTCMQCGACNVDHDNVDHDIDFLLNLTTWTIVCNLGPLWCRKIINHFNFAIAVNLSEILKFSFRLAVLGLSRRYEHELSLVCSLFPICWLIGNASLSCYKTVLIKIFIFSILYHLR